MAGGCAEVRGYPEPEEAVGVEIRCVERVDIGSELSAEEPGEFRTALDGGDTRELRFERRCAQRVDGRLIEVCPVKVSHLAPFCSLGCLGLDGLIEERARPS